MSVDLPLPISTGRATSPVGASDGASATGSQGAPSAFDALMATLGPAEPTGDTQTPDDGAPAATTPEQQSDTTALPVAAQPATAVAPQLISALDLPAAADIAPLPTTAQAAPRKDGKAEDEAVQSAASSPIDEDVSSDTTPVALSVVTAEPAVAPVLLQTQTESAAPACQDATPATVKPVPLKAPAAARSGKASDADKNNDDARKPVTADAAPAP
ncbi:MAG: hypothetical protein JF571_04945, partial [Asticcacaulis sp.]|nr:hypothetical protein [Asticcacaulis sp.]